ncbi:Putative nitrogenase FeMo-cofactor carrier protein [Candidatus Hydrogenisulfobacillus filiaventi]|uniref:Nitrogenase FeMo-cofactor carrier protein n=1 Tax=Candidatus Hydrogenisulfobacillus filiaventi TaxID=2707344 RepID=A0A6F8ZE72_9FIRM|nr:nitrogen fixation protein NifX [Bacillota bacterium]CAB1127960.1 Putative nitrogenase FeMo-cofactor carrier protein [Candidatus Hydrogenisulfobacillus filiaventi]
MKVAFATTDGIFVNDHFAWSRWFAVYEVDADNRRLLEMRGVPPGRGDDEEDPDAEEDRIAVRIDLLNDVHLLYVTAIGGPAAARVIRARIHPVKVSGVPPIAGVLDELQGVLQKAPPPWLRRILEREKLAGSSR